MKDKFKSRKFLITVFISIATVFIPIAYKANGISESVTLAVLGILGGVGVAYGIIESKIDIMKEKNGTSQ